MVDVLFKIPMHQLRAHDLDSIEDVVRLQIAVMVTYKGAGDDPTLTQLATGWSTPPRFEDGFEVSRHQLLCIRRSTLVYEMVDKGVQKLLLGPARRRGPTVEIRGHVLHGAVKVGDITERDFVGSLRT